MAYFLDRVRGAFSVDEIQGSFPEVWKKLNGPIEKKEFESWGDIALKHGEEERVTKDAIYGCILASLMKKYHPNIR